MPSNLSQKIIAEFVGTLFLVASVLGAGHMTRALGAGSAEGLTMIALAVGFVLVVIVSVFGPISGGHFNPAVSLMMALRRELSPSLTSAYIFSQILGAATGAFFANVMFGASSWSLSDVDRNGSGLWVGEAFATFGLVLLILVLLDRDRVSWIPAGVGLWVAGGHFFTSSTSFANPAVTIGRMLSNAPSSISLESALYFIIFQLLGALAALGVATVLKPTLAEARG